MCIRDSGVPGVAINTEGAQLEKFELNCETAYKMDNKGSQFVLWNDSRYQFMVITQNMPMEEAVRIAESVTVCPADAPHPPQLTPKFGPPLDYPKDQAAANGDIVISGGEIENLSPVSYTHLDVYKRQVSGRVRDAVVGPERL